VDDVIRIGIDENGLGPRLGPLVVTAVEAVTTGAGHAKAESRPRGALRERLDDSKKLVAYGDSALGEAWARAIARRMGHAGPSGPASPEELVRILSLDSADALRSPCPTDHRAQCWDEGGEAFACDPVLLAKVERDLDRLEAQGVDVKRATSVVTCTRRLNDGVARGLTRFHLDLHAMERLALDARARNGREITATCGKVGGFDRYEAAFGPMSGHLRAVEIEGRACSAYVFPGVGRLAFVRDADAKHLLVSMASLVGKWVRDLLMGRIVRHYRAGDPELPDASGYHDPVTTRFIEATRLARKRRAVPDDCFVRRALGAT
jgi:ribonuclease HII